MPITLNGSGSIGGLASGINGVGKVLQVVQYTYSTQTTITANGWTTVNPTGTITPSSSSSKILAIASINAVCSTGGTNGGVTIARGGTPLAGSASRGSCIIGATQGAPATMFILDSPASTSTLTYAITYKHDNGTNMVYCFGNTVDSLTLIEVAP